MGLVADRQKTGRFSDGAAVRQTNSSEQSKLEVDGLYVALCFSLQNGWGDGNARVDFRWYDVAG